MATINNTPAIRNVPKVEFVSVYEASAVAATTVIQMLTIPARFRVTSLRLDFDDLGTGVTVDVGDSVADFYLDGTDVATSAGTASWKPAADSLGRLYTAEDTIDILVIGAAATGSIRLVAEGHFDYDSVS